MINNTIARQYDKLYFGGNQKEGSDKPSLSFNSQTKKIVFKPDSENIFEYPEYAITQSIINTSLIDDGATSGTSPILSDYIKYAEECALHGDQIMANDFGVYLCTWLYKESKNSNSTPIWIDRWYKPEQINEEDALASKKNSNNDAVLDANTSSFIFEPNIKYNYRKYGSYINRTHVNDIDNLIFHYNTNWSNLNGNFKINTDDHNLVNRYAPFTEPPTPYTIQDAQKNIQAYNYKTANDSVLYLDGNSATAYLNYTPKHHSNNFFTSLWCNTNWNIPNGQYILSNGFRSGWNLKINTGFNNHIMAYVGKGSTTGLYDKIIVYNIEGVFIALYDLAETTKNNISININIYDYIIDDDMFMYFISEEDVTGGAPKLFLHKLDLTTGFIISRLEKDNENQNFTGNARKIVIGTNRNEIRFYTDEFLYIINNKYDFDVTEKIQTDSLETFLIIGNINIQGDPDKIELDQQERIIDLCPGDTNPDIDNDNNLWWLNPDNNLCMTPLVVNNTVHQLTDSDINIQKFHCAEDNKIWILYINKDNKYELALYDITNISEIINNEYLTIYKTASFKTTLDQLTNTNNLALDLFYYQGHTRCSIIDVTNSFIYIYDDTGKLIYENNFNGISTELLPIATTSYKNNRIFEYAKNNNQTKQIEFEYYTIDNNDSISRNSLKTPITDLADNEWHHFTFGIYDNNIYLYIDTIEKNTVTTTDPIYFKYETPIYIGTPSGKINELSKTTLVKNYEYLKGSVDDLRIYENKKLEQSDIELIYIDKYRYTDFSFNINCIEPFDYIEEINRFFKFKLPGSTSQYYNIKISGYKTSDENTKKMIEDIIHNTVQFVAPTHTQLHKIIWVE
jgi:hypothetical protein